MRVDSFIKMPLNDQINHLYRYGSFVTDIRYYAHKVNLYLIKDEYYEVFVSQKSLVIENITPLDFQSNRLDLYLDQIELSIAS
ncbi:hypothetical protein [Reichenbachiella versicolor]|uniref:hypothetical protein n=1 Tax=Reichenbachiella versicolor TaxID=1821036 RepID=UPI000D6E3637|nr:hypothetical protein [Reichenbachiella versicolor]